MKGLYFDGQSVCFRDDLPKPTPQKDESLVRVLMAAVCNTDREILKGYRPDFKGVMGHEFVGVVEESRNPELVGKRVVGELNAFCGECIYCKTGRYSHCSNRRVLGIHDKDGCFAQYMTINTSLLHIVPECLDTKQAVYTEPLAAAYEILTQVKIPKNETVGILGDGRLAYCVAQMLHACDYAVEVIGKHPEKLALFEAFAKTTTVRRQEAYEVLVEATGSQTGLRQAFEMVRKKGTIVLKSTYAGEIALPMSLVAVNEITILGSRCGPFAPAIATLAEGKVSFPEITLFPLEEYEQAFAFSGFKAGFSM